MLDYLVEIDKILAVEKCEELYVNHVFSLVFVSKHRVSVGDLNSNLRVVVELCWIISWRLTNYSLWNSARNCI